MNREPFLCCVAWQDLEFFLEDSCSVAGFESSSFFCWQMALNLAVWVVLQAPLISIIFHLCASLLREALEVLGLDDLVTLPFCGSSLDLAAKCCSHSMGSTTF
ncbi:hypothetical protein KP509_04G074600 [Ceratopteris richardii]|uniref:Uncharacterized protein n=1 Tax=Ceratopteris richardii TaxID=49495 RepID=A0A8T2UWX2_CERRI|nr:hypothetical protein KP509_04G074600 [Ceratopteris richardii]